ncbi:hypothetical protein GO730_29125 [Spirosoma sp. HMF3257]|uniref:Uncharacterized protein n=1 Tax=Spirosoma telluris TaxID=2183553 RepID=A0A327NTD7_9BACT|nr:hypothetical protein [Spirosoma telluris]RAI77226.1 hypothetical protein HMF3257_29045 [Spirosoma telluris]
MKKSLAMLSLLLSVGLATAQTKPASSTASPTPPTIISVIEGVSGKRFLPDTAFVALSEEDETLLSKEPIANWSLLQESGPAMTYSNLVIGTRSYQLIITKLPREVLPTATLLRFDTPKSKPEPIARGTLKPKTEEKPK